MRTSQAEKKLINADHIAPHYTHLSRIHLPRLHRNIIASHHLHLPAAHYLLTAATAIRPT